jgi:hypothetical protein
MFQDCCRRTRAKEGATAAGKDTAIWYEDEEEEGNGKREDAKDSRFV